jgi:hypothetical protein
LKKLSSFAGFGYYITMGGNIAEQHRDASKRKAEQFIGEGYTAVRRVTRF